MVSLLAAGYARPLMSRARAVRARWAQTLVARRHAVASTFSRSRGASHDGSARATALYGTGEAAPAARGSAAGPCSTRAQAPRGHRHGLSEPAGARVHRGQALS